MGAPRIHRRVIAEQERAAKALRRGLVPRVSVAQDIATGEILAIGVSGNAVARELEKRNIPAGTWEVKDHIVWR